MKVTFLAVASALAGLGRAQFNGLPSCATPCVLEFTTGGGNTVAGCDRLKIDCICANSSFLSSIACCLAEKCSVDDQQKAVSFAQDLCKANGVTNLPSAVACTSTATSSLPTGTSTTSSAAATTTPSGSTRSASTSAPATVASNAVSGTSSSAPTSSTPNAGPTNAAGIGAGMLGGLAAVVALL